MKAACRTCDITEDCQMAKIIHLSLITLKVEMESSQQSTQHSCRTKKQQKQIYMVPGSKEQYSSQTAATGKLTTQTNQLLQLFFYLI